MQLNVLWTIAFFFLHASTGPFSISLNSSLFWHTEIILVVTYLVQSSNNLASFLVYSLWAPMTINVFQCLCNPIVFPKPQCMQRGQGQTLIDPTVSSTETLHPLPLRILVAGWWQSGYEWKVGSSFGILELAVDSKFPIQAREVTEGAFQLWNAAIHSRSIHEWCDAIHLLPLQSFSNIRPKIEKTSCYGAKKRHAALCTRDIFICL